MDTEYGNVQNLMGMQHTKVQLSNCGMVRWVEQCTQLLKVQNFKQKKSAGAKEP